MAPTDKRTKIAMFSRSFEIIFTVLTSTAVWRMLQ